MHSCSCALFCSIGAYNGGLLCQCIALSNQVATVLRLYVHSTMLSISTEVRQGNRCSWKFLCQQSALIHRRFWCHPTLLSQPTFQYDFSMVARCPDSSVSSYTSVHHRHGCPDSLPYLTRTNAFFLAVLAVDHPKGPCTQAFSNCRCMLLMHSSLFQTVGACCSISAFDIKGPSSCFLMTMHCCWLIVMLHNLPVHTMGECVSASTLSVYLHL
jgi:hypothetical protein